jgi:hypothetical protein
MKPINLNFFRCGMSFHKDAVKCKMECCVVNIHNASYSANDIKEAFEDVDEEEDDEEVRQ